MNPLAGDVIRPGFDVEVAGHLLFCMRWAQSVKVLRNTYLSCTATLSIFVLEVLTVKWFAVLYFVGKNHTGDNTTIQNRTLYIFCSTSFLLTCWQPKNLPNNASVYLWFVNVAACKSFDWSWLQNRIPCWRYTAILALGGMCASELMQMVWTDGRIIRNFQDLRSTSLCVKIGSARN